MGWWSRVVRDEPWAAWTLLEASKVSSDPAAHIFFDRKSSRVLRRYGSDTFSYQWAGERPGSTPPEPVGGDTSVGKIYGTSRIVSDVDFIADEITFQVDVTAPSSNPSSSYVLMALGQASGSGEPAVATQNAVLFWDTARKLKWSVDGTTIASPTAVLSGVIQVSVGPDGMRLWVDGAEVASSGAKTALPGGPQRLWLRKGKADAGLGIGVQPSLSTGIKLPVVFDYQLSEEAMLRQWRVAVTRFGALTEGGYGDASSRRFHFPLDGTTVPIYSSATPSTGTIVGAVTTQEDSLLGQPGKSMRFAGGRIVLPDTHVVYSDGLAYRYMPELDNGGFLSVLVRPERTTGWNLITGYGIGRNSGYSASGSPKQDWALYVANGRFVWRQETVKFADSTPLALTFSFLPISLVVGEEYAVSIDYRINTATRVVTVTMVVNGEAQVFTGTQGRLGSGTLIASPKWCIGSWNDGSDPFLGRIDDLYMKASYSSTKLDPLLIDRTSYPAREDPTLEIQGDSSIVDLASFDGSNELVEVEQIERDGQLHALQVLSTEGDHETEVGVISMPINTLLGRESAAAGYAAVATHMSLHTADPSSGNEVVDSPYVRRPITWEAGDVDGIYTATVVDFDVPADTTITHVGLWTALEDGELVDYTEIEEQIYVDAGPLEITGVTLTMS